MWYLIRFSLRLINIKRRSPKFADYWNIPRYGSFPFEGLDGFVIMNAFQANHLSTYPPSSTMSPELSCAFRMIVFALEQDPWNHTPVLSYSRYNNRYGTGHIQMLNVGSNKIRGVSHATDFVLDRYSWSCAVYRNLRSCTIPIPGSQRSLFAWSRQVTGFKFVERELFVLDAEVAVLETKAGLDKQTGWANGFDARFGC